jgi:heterotetrameric sarcosine oxidase gamma subunit
MTSGRPALKELSRPQQTPTVVRLGEDTTLLARPEMGCLLVNSSLDAAAVVKDIAAVVRFEFPVEPGTTTYAQSLRALWLTPRSWLLHCSSAEESALEREFGAAFQDKRVHAMTYSDHLSWFELSGSESLNRLTAGGFVSLERGGLSVGRVKRTALAGIDVTVFRAGAETWLLAVERSRARYFVTWISAPRLSAG